MSGRIALAFFLAKKTDGILPPAYIDLILRRYLAK